MGCKMQLNISLVPEKKDEQIPIAAAGHMMVDIQTLLSCVGEYIVSDEFNSLGPISDKIKSRFILYMDGKGGMGLKSSAKSSSASGHGSLTDDAVEILIKILENAKSKEDAYWIDDDIIYLNYRKDIANTLISISNHLTENKCILVIGNESKTFEIKEIDVEKYKKYIDNCGNKVPGFSNGVIVRDGNRFVIKHGRNLINLEFMRPEFESLVRPFLNTIPVIVPGIVVYGDNGYITEIKGAENVIELKSMKFHRMISETGDLKLKESLIADVSYLPEKDSWKLSNSDLGISVTKKEWDEAIEAFHDYFVFLWETYAEKLDQELEGEELDVRTELLRLAGPKA